MIRNFDVLQDFLIKSLNDCHRSRIQLCVNLNVQTFPPHLSTTSLSGWKQNKGKKKLISKLKSPTKQRRLIPEINNKLKIV